MTIEKKKCEREAGVPAQPGVSVGTSFRLGADKDLKDTEIDFCDQIWGLGFYALKLLLSFEGGGWAGTDMTDTWQGREVGEDGHDTRPVPPKQVAVQIGDSFNEGLCTGAVEPAPYLPSLGSMGLGVFSLQYM